MGFNPFKALKGITKPFKKILRSPIGKAALGIGAFMYGPKLLGAQNIGGAGGWGQAWKGLPPWLMGGTETTEGLGGILHQKTTPSLLGRFKNMSTLGKAATVGVGAAAAGALGDDVMEKSETIIDTSGHDDYLNSRKMFVDEWTDWLIAQGHDEDTARAMAEKELFNKAEGGLIGLAQGGRIDLQQGSHRGGFEETEAAGKSYEAYTAPGGEGAAAWQNQALQQHKEQQALKALVNKQEAAKKEELVETLRNKNIGDGWWKGPLNKQMSVNQNFFLNKVLPAQKGMFEGVDIYGMSDQDQEALYQNWMDQRQSGAIDTYGRDTTSGGGGGSGLNFNASVGTGGVGTGGGTGGAGTGDTTGDYYGFDEWADWAGAPTTPMFGDTTKYKALLNRGGRIGLYAGGMGAMNSPMNPMMNQGLGAMGSQGMNPYNQQNLMAQGQMRGQPQGRPPIPGGPTTDQGPGLASLQSAKVPQQNEDNELLKLIKMLASMGIPMEQLRGRTKEELVEMVMSLSAKAEAQGGGREEVVEEQEEEVVESAGGGLMRTGYAMGTEQPIIPSRDGAQIDYRGIGGYQPHGAKEKKDDVRALLAQGEFVVTSDAVKGIGEGDRDLGAKRMYDMMHKYEPIGRALS